LKNSAVSAALPKVSKIGALYAVLAYTAWGILPLYWKLFGHIPALEVLSHRIIWSMVFLTALLVFQQRGSEVYQLARSPKTLSALLLTTVLISFNWGFFIYSIAIDHVVEASLGYYINPLVSVLLGAVFLKERLNRGQTIAVVLVGVGVTNFVAQFGHIPWIALGLAVSFALYGLLRKLIPVTPLVGLTVETGLATPIALIFIEHLAIGGTGHLGINVWFTALFIGCGVVTSVPLLWFNNAAKQLRLSTLGFFQYLAPSLQLLLGVYLYHEPFTLTHAVTFALIWSALVIYSVTSLRTRQRSV
jgi:chloramphenicol-sensitive protein RarD